MKWIPEQSFDAWLRRLETGRKLITDEILYLGVLHDDMDPLLMDRHPILAKAFNDESPGRFRMLQEYPIAKRIVALGDDFEDWYDICNQGAFGRDNRKQLVVYNPVTNRFAVETDDVKVTNHAVWYPADRRKNILEQANAL